MKFNNLTVIASLALILTACGSNPAPADNDQNKTDNTVAESTNVSTNASDSTEKTTSQSEPVDNSNIYFSTAPDLKGIDAANVLLEKYPDAKIESVSFESDDFKYEVTANDGTSEYEMKIDPKTGDIIKEEKDNDTDNKFITIDQIKKAESLIEKAISDNGSEYKVKDWDMDFEDGFCKIDIELEAQNGNEIDVEYNVDDN